MEKNHNEKPECNLGYSVPGGVLCLGCTLRDKDEKFILENEPVEIDLNELCFSCGLKFKDANTDRAVTEIFILCHL